MPSIPPYSSTFNPFSMDSPPSISRPLPSSTSEHSRRGIVAHHLPNTSYRGTLPQQRQHSSRLSPSSQDSWTYNPVFGIVHSFSGCCSVCNAYVDHVVTAMNRGDVSFTQAVEARKDSQDMFFMDGFGEGMRHQRDNDLQLNQENEHLRSKLDTATTENESLRKELDQVKQRLANLEESMRLKISSTGPMAGLPSRPSPSTSGSFGLGSRDSSIGSFMELQHRIGQDTNLTSPRPLFAKTEPHETRITTTLNERQPNQVDDPTQPFQSTYASVASGHTSGNPDSHSPPNLPPRPWLSESSPSSRAHQQPPTTSTRDQHDKPRMRHPKTMKELKDLMDLAREPTSEGAAALAVVKSVCSRAHSTPRDNKTFMQRWILMNWKNPYATASNTSSASAADVKPNPRIDDPVDVWYEYLCTHPHSWPKGVRKDELGRPVMSDLIANRAVARMRPTDSAASRNDYIAHVTDMFAVPGMYKHLVERNNFVIASEVSYRPFTGPITAENIARHFAESGFTLNDATTNFEPWAKHYKEC